MDEKCFLCMVHPWVRDCVHFLNNEFPWGQTRGTGTIWIPIMCLRWTHDGIDGRFAFRDSRPIMELALDLWHKGWSWSVDVPALDVVVDEDGFLWCLSNRRLAALRILQALTASTVWARCSLHGPKHRRFESSKTTQNGGIGVVPNYSPQRFM